MLRHLGYFLIGFVVAASLMLTAAAAVEPPVMDDKPLLLGDCVAVGEVRFPDGKTLVRFNCSESGATVFVPREKIEVPAYDAPLRKDEREL